MINLHNNKKGAAMMIFIVMFMFSTVSITYMIAHTVYADIIAHRTLVSSKSSYLTALAANEEIASRLVHGASYDSIEVMTLAGAMATSTIAYDSAEGIYTIISEGRSLHAVRKSEINLIYGEGASFNYGLQSDAGGIELKNDASIRGNVFSNGAIVGANSNIIRGEAISAGPTGLINGVHATGTAYANTIKDSTIGGDAHYQVISNTTVEGTLHPDSSDQATSSLPISDEQIEEWKDAAVLGGTYNGACPYKVDEDVTLGPIKIPCDLEIKGDPIVTLAGYIWVEGDITVQNTAHVQIDDSLSGKSIAIIADYPADPATKGIIEFKNSTTFEGAGDKSYVLFISQNTSAEEGGGTTAIQLDNSAEGDLLVFAGHGKILLKNSVSLKEVSAYRIEVQNSAEVVYESGLANLLFTSGPGGGFVISSWREIE
ncbi:MAG: hypothetical protein WDZ68_01920 [Candidatus Paceibacterota bacterium]